jgi:dihydroorotate dehydrogenase electron transfer subunit
VTVAPAESPRPLGPLHVRALLLTTRKVGAYHHLTLSAPGVAERFRPGTFVALSVGAGDAAYRTRLARRSFWVHRVKPTGGHGLTIEIVVEAVGPGTRWLAGLGQGAEIDLTGPLGRPFSLPKESTDQKQVSCVLVGHGHAAAPLFPLAERLRERGCAVTLVLSAPDESHLLAALEARRSARAVTVVTGDGSVGLRGSAEEHLPGIFERAATDVVYACGPALLLHAVAAAAEQQGAWSQVALEEPLVCATGLCHGCAVPVVGEDGAPRTVRACVDGPVFRGDRVRWDDLTGVSA